jgi:hypothetical protein
MNLFRSEEHARNWTQFDVAFLQNLQPLSVWAERFSAERHRARIRPDYISWLKAQRP